MNLGLLEVGNGFDEESVGTRVYIDKRKRFLRAQIAREVCVA